jgi:proteasome accessory factor C
VSVTPSTPAPGGAKDQVNRLLTLVPYLHAREGVRLDEAASALGVPPSQLMKDLKVLLMCGLPGGYPDDLIDVDLDALEGQEADGVIRVSNADYLARPLRLTPTEATALIVALRAVRGGAAASTREVVDRTLAKLEAAAAEGGGAGRIQVDEQPSEQAEVLHRLRGALERGRQVRLTYWVPTRDEATERRVDPRGIVTSPGATYLDGWCHAARAPRLFRLDRIHDLEVLDAPAEAHEEAPKDVTDGFFRGSEEAVLVTVELDPPAQWVPEYYPVESVRPLTGGSSEVQLLVADERWLERLLLRLAPHARVVSPARLGDEVMSTAQRALRLYRQHGVD